MVCPLTSVWIPKKEQLRNCFHKMHLPNIYFSLLRLLHLELMSKCMPMQQCKVHLHMPLLFPSTHYQHFHYFRQPTINTFMGTTLGSALQHVLIISMQTTPTTALHHLPTNLPCLTTQSHPHQQAISHHLPTNLPCLAMKSHPLQQAISHHRPTNHPYLATRSHTHHRAIFHHPPKNHPFFVTQSCHSYLANHRHHMDKEQTLHLRQPYHRHLSNL